MTASGEQLDALAGILAYPGADFADRMARCGKLLAGAPPEARQGFQRFSEGCNGRSPEELQELYTRTFDMNPGCALEIGWHLYGENYSRGEFLVDMRRELRSHGLKESAELPDHLVHVLPIVARMESDRAGTFVSSRVIPAIDKILAAMTGKECAYEPLLRVIRVVIEAPSGEVAKEGMA